MSKTRIGVVRGGPSSEYEVSLNSGLNVINALKSDPDESFHVVDILLDRNGQWHVDGIPVSLENVHRKVDLIFNALHGEYGEDGKIQHLFEANIIPFTGSGSLASALGMNKLLSKEVFKKHNIKTPYHIFIESSQIVDDPDMIAKKIFSSFVLPAVIKPVSGGSSVGVSVVRNIDEIKSALILASKYSEQVIIEEFISGIEATCGVVEHFRGQSLYALPPVEIRTNNNFFDYKAKYHGESEEIVPATFGDSTKKELEDLAKTVHQIFGLKHYSRTDFIIHPRRGVYVLEVNTLPGLTEQSLLPKSLRAIGSSVSEFVRHVVGLVRG
jgi:D-alanine-D-alanine ligase